MDSEAVGIRGIFPARFPKLKFLAGWPAYPWQDEMIAILVHKGNVHYELHSGRRRPSRRARRARKRGPETAVQFRFREECLSEVNQRYNLISRDAAWLY